MAWRYRREREGGRGVRGRDVGREGGREGGRRENEENAKIEAQKGWRGRGGEGR